MKLGIKDIELNKHELRGKTHIDFCTQSVIMTLGWWEWGDYHK